MIDKDRQFKQTTELRWLAEETVREGMGPSPGNLDAPISEEIRLMFHELSVHQIEIELQNEELRRTQAELDSARARYFDLYDLAPVGYCTLSDTGLILEANLTAATLLSVARGTLVKQPLSRFILKEDQDLYSLRRIQDLDIRGPQVCELRMVKEDGTVFWAHLAISAAQQAGGAPESRLVISDISDRKRAEEALREREAQYRQIVDTAQEGIWGMDENWRTTYVNTRMAELLGYEPHEMDQRPAEDFMYAEDAADHVLRMQEQKQGQNGTYERRFRRKDGREIWTLVSATAQMDKNGGFTGTFAMLTDITKRKRAEAALKQSEQQANNAKNLLKLVLDTIPVRLFWKDLSSVFLGCNQLFAEDAGYQVPEELIGLDDFDMGWKEQAEIYRRDDYEVMNSGEPKLHYEEIQTTPDGRQIWLSTSKVPLRDADDNIIGVLGAYEDITLHKMAEEELLKTQKLESLGLLAGGLAHDFNNILMVIMGNISFAKMLLSPTDTAYERLTIAETAAVKAKDLTRQFHTFSKGGAPVKSSIAVANLIKNYGRFVLSGTKSTCENTIPDDLWNIDADEGQIGQTLTNILINADQAMPDGGVIRIDCENAVIRDDHGLPLKNGRYVKISIKDQGNGIPEEYLGKVFDPYFTTKAKGRGLGLASAYSIMKKHEGHIAVESTAGAGTTLTLYIPASASLAVTPMVDEPELMGGNGKILVMDDDEVILQIIGSMLENLGYDVAFAQDGQEALSKYVEAQLSGEPFDVVIMDLIVPGGMGGKEAMQKLLATDPQARAIVSSGYSNDPVMVDYKNFGFSGVIAKPYHPAELNKLMQQVLHS